MTVKQAARIAAYSVADRLTRPAGIRMVAPLFGLGSRSASDRHIRLSEAASVLVIRPDEIGDYVLTTPLLRELKAAVPNVRLGLVVKQTVVDLASRCPHVDAVYAFDAPRPVDARARLTARLAAMRFGRDVLRPEAWDIALVPRRDVDLYQCALLAFASGAGRRIGYSESWSRRTRVESRGNDLLLTEAIGMHGGLHEVEAGLTLLEHLGVPRGRTALELWPDPDADDQAASLMGPVSSEDRPLAVLGVGANNPKRVWPAERFAQLAAALRDRGMRTAVVGSATDHSAGAEIAAVCGDSCTDLCGRTPLPALASVLRRAKLFVGNDSGPMHLAAAAGAAVVMVSCHSLRGAPDHENAPERFGPWETRSRILRPEEPTEPCPGHCAADSPHCILAVSTGEVLTAVDQVLEVPNA